MASYRLAEVLKSRTGLSDAEIERMSEDEAWEWIRTNAPVCEQTDLAQDEC